MDRVISQPAEEPITLDQLRTQLGIMDENATERDSVLVSNITAARIWAEWFTQRAFITQSWGYYADAFPRRDMQCGLDRDRNSNREAIDLKLDLQEVTFVKYINEDGVITTLDPLKYQVDLISSRVLPGYGMSWPNTRRVPNAVQISYVSGYGSANAVPEDIKKALLIIAGQWENFQTALESGMTVRSVSWAAIQLLSNYKDYRKVF